MDKYLINSDLHGYNKQEINSFDASDVKDSLIITVVNKGCDDKVGAYYKMIRNALSNFNRVILIGVNDENRVFKTLACLMTTYRAYDIYTVESEESLSIKEVLAMEDRHPDLTEVQTYIGGDVTAYSDMSAILFGIESLVSEGNSDKLKEYLNEHMLSIENLTSTLDSMKKTCDIFNSDELIDKINKLIEEKKELNAKIDVKDSKLKELEYDKTKLKVDYETLQRENRKIISEKEAMEASANLGGNVLKAYKPIKTPLIHCRTKIVLYFKEISYVQYVNSLVMHLLYMLTSVMKIKAKLLIYDTQTNMYSSYGSLRIVSSQAYISNKHGLISKNKAFVVSEPNSSIIKDVLESDQSFDVVIVYDRMKNPIDVVEGNNVYKFFVINSSQEFSKMYKELKIKDLDYVITRPGSTIGLNEKDTFEGSYIDIPSIDDYSKATNSAKLSKYIRLASMNDKQNILNKIQSLANIDSMR